MRYLFLFHGQMMTILRNFVPIHLIGTLRQGVGCTGHKNLTWHQWFGLLSDLSDKCWLWQKKRENLCAFNKSHRGKIDTKSLCSAVICVMQMQRQLCTNYLQWQEIACNFAFWQTQKVSLLGRYLHRLLLNPYTPSPETWKRSIRKYCDSLSLLVSSKNPWSRFLNDTTSTIRIVGNWGAGCHCPVTFLHCAGILLLTISGVRWPPTNHRVCFPCDLVTFSCREAASPADTWSVCFFRLVWIWASILSFRSLTDDTKYKNRTIPQKTYQQETPAWNWEFFGGYSLTKHFVCGSSVQIWGLLRCRFLHLLGWFFYGRSSLAGHEIEPTKNQGMHQDTTHSKIVSDK